MQAVIKKIKVFVIFVSLSSIPRSLFPLLTRAHQVSMNRVALLAIGIDAPMLSQGFRVYRVLIGFQLFASGLDTFRLPALGQLVAQLHQIRQHPVGHGSGSWIGRRNQLIEFLDCRIEQSGVRYLSAIRDRCFHP
jgi:hypothetical protein